MSKQVEELVEWVAEQCYFGDSPRTHSWGEVESDFPNVAEAMRRMAKLILSHPDLYLIVDGYALVGQEQDDYARLPVRRVIPLAKALKEGM